VLLLVSVKLFNEPTVKLSTSNWLTQQVYPRKWPLKRCACVQLVIFIISELRHRKKIEQLRDNETHCRCPVGASAQMRSYLMSSVTRSCDIKLSKCRPPPKEANTFHTHNYTLGVFRVGPRSPPGHQNAISVVPDFRPNGSFTYLQRSGYRQSVGPYTKKWWIPRSI